MAYQPGAGSGGGLASASGFNQNIESQGLNTISVTVPYAGLYFVKGKIILPIPQGSGQSSLVITVNQNGSAIYTGLVGAEGFYVNASCAASDVLAVVPSSSNALDTALNAVKLVISVSQGV